MRNKIYFVKIMLVMFVLTIIAMSSCTVSENKSEVEESLQNMGEKFPELKNPTSYPVKRSVRIEEISVTLELRRNELSENKEEVITVINSKGKAYSFPFFSNKYHDYWEFEFDKKPDSASTTFEKELKTALDNLQLNTSATVQTVLLEELLYSLLHTEDIELVDSTALNTVRMNEITEASMENVDICSERIRKNVKEVIGNLNSKTAITPYKSFWDKRNGRIYEFYFPSFSKEKLEYSITTYRHNCPYNQLSL